MAAEKANSYNKILEYYRLYCWKKIQHKRNIIDEYKKCMKDAIYFANTYCKLKTPKGIKPIKVKYRKSL